MGSMGKKCMLLLYANFLVNPFTLRRICRCRNTCRHFVGAVWYSSPDSLLDLDILSQLINEAQGVYHLPGDRVGVLAENDQDLVHRTVAALQATGDELVPPGNVQESRESSRLPAIHSAQITAQSIPSCCGPTVARGG